MQDKNKISNSNSPVSKEKSDKLKKNNEKCPETTQKENGKTFIKIEYSSSSEDENQVNKSKTSNENSTTHQCKNCSEMISVANLSEHSRICTRTSEYVRKTSNGYQCKLCFTKRDSRQMIFQHIDEECQKNMSTKPIPTIIKLRADRMLKSTQKSEVEKEINKNDVSTAGSSKYR